MKRVYITVSNDLATDQRVRRVAQLLVDNGIEVICIGRLNRNSADLGSVPFKYCRYRMLFKKGPLFYAAFNIRLLITLIFARKPSLFIANDLDTLPGTFSASKLRKVELIYDSHELFTQVPELIHRKRVQKIWKRIEGFYLPRIKHAVTVSYPIAEIYRRLYGTRFSVVRNVPFRVHLQSQSNFRERSGYSDKSIIIYQGALNVGRGLELMIDTMLYLDQVIFVVAGTGDIEQELLQRVEKLGLNDRIDFTGRLLPEELAPITMSADLGISLEEDLGRNYRYALPNKLFDYIQCRIPVLCSDLPEMKRIVETYGVGVASGEREPEKLAGMIRYMLEERSKGAWRDALDRAAEQLCWENESPVYMDVLSACKVLS